MIFTWLNFGGILSETILTIFFVKFQMRFLEWDFRGKSGLCYILATNALIATRQQANISIERLVLNDIIGFDLGHDLDL